MVIRKPTIWKSETIENRTKKCPVFEWHSKTEPFGNWPNVDHSKTGREPDTSVFGSPLYSKELLKFPTISKQKNAKLSFFSLSCLNQPALLEFDLAFNQVMCENANDEVFVLLIALANFTGFLFCFVGICGTWVTDKSGFGRMLKGPVLDLSVPDL